MKPDDIDSVIRILRREVRRWPVPVIGEYTHTPFTVLISCLLSLRTKDAVTDAASRRLFSLAANPEGMLGLDRQVIEREIYPVSFYRVKARTIHRICQELERRFGGDVPDSLDQLLTLPGVGRKTANIVVTLAFRKPGIAVDTHVHRIFNRWGYVRTTDPDKTELALRRKLPKRHWRTINDILVAFGQHHCKPVSPHCSTCKLIPYCARRGVRISR